jgi:hypothetical protein
MQILFILVLTPKIHYLLWFTPFSFPYRLDFGHQHNLHCIPLGIYMLAKISMQKHFWYDVKPTNIISLWQIQKYFMYICDWQRILGRLFWQQV